MDGIIVGEGASILREVTEGDMTSTPVINQDAIYGLIIGAYLLIIALAIAIGILIGKVIRLQRSLADYQKEVDDIAMGRLKPEDLVSEDIIIK